MECVRKKHYEENISKKKKRTKRRGGPKGENSGRGGEFGFHGRKGQYFSGGELSPKLTKQHFEKGEGPPVQEKGGELVRTS